MVGRYRLVGGVVVSAVALVIDPHSMSSRVALGILVGPRMATHVRFCAVYIFTSRPIAPESCVYGNGRRRELSEMDDLAQARRKTYVYHQYASSCEFLMR